MILRVPKLFIYSKSVTSLMTLSCAPLYHNKFHSNYAVRSGNRHGRKNVGDSWRDSRPLENVPQEHVGLAFQHVYFFRNNPKFATTTHNNTTTHRKSREVGDKISARTDITIPTSIIDIIASVFMTAEMNGRILAVLVCNRSG